MPALTDGRLHPEVFLNQLRGITEGIFQEWKAVMDELGFDVTIGRIDIVESPSRYGADAHINLRLTRRNE